jgi:tRNA A-37 threonylcarbamoyl transferase component Bud32
LAQNLKDSSKAAKEEILNFCRHIAGSNHIAAICVSGDCASGLSSSKALIDVLLVIQGFQPRLMNYVKVFGDRTMIVLAVDQWVFERDVDRGFLGEALASRLIFPYVAQVNPSYLHDQEVKLKKRLTLELLENLVLDFPELSYELRIRAEYFMYGTIQSRVRLFPSMIYVLTDLMNEENRERNTSHMLRGFTEALKELEKEGTVVSSDGYVKVSSCFADKAKNPRVRVTNLLKPAQRALFTSLLGIFPSILNAFSQNREILARLQGGGSEDAKIISQFEVPEKYAYVPTATGLVPLANRTDIKAFARKVLSAGEDVKVTVERLGGVLNDVYLIRARVDEREKKAVVKSFKDWSSFKWFPLTLWSVGTKTFAVLGRSRLERECAINQLLHSKGFAVPRILHVSQSERLVFMEYVEGEDLASVIRRVAGSKVEAEVKRDLRIIGKVGRKFGKVHEIGIALGDTKPENIKIGKKGEVFLMDFEQASRNGDKVWDVAEFLYYAGHDIPPFVNLRVAERIAEAFIRGYFEAGGAVKTVKKAGTPKYTKVFSVFTFPHVMLALSDMCRKADKLR